MHFGSIHVLKKREREAEALELLTRAAKQVQPIMKQRGWSVGQLMEFFPSNPNLLGLNVNKTQQIKIRLRPARAPDSFYEWHDVLGTMLHELAHIVHSAHNAAFYKLLDELWAEAEALMDQGITGTGAGFDLRSAGRLGSHAFIPQHNPPEHRMGDAIRKAAEARAKKQAIMLAGPRKLGGSSGSSSRYRGMTPAQAAAAAAERRAADNLWCPAEHDDATLQQELGGNGGAAGSSSSSGSGGAGRAAAVRVAAAAAAGKQHGGRGLVASAPAAAAAAGAGVGGSGAATQAAQPQLRCVGGAAQQQQQQSLQQGWQQHVQQRQQQRVQRLQSRKRPAAEAIDLTLSDDDDDDAAAAADDDDAGGPCCPACAQPLGSAAAGPEMLAGALAGARSTGFRRWCERHRQQQQQQRGTRWACYVCTLLNPAGERQCQACQTERGER